jgi:hypothetical protein
MSRIPHPWLAWIASASDRELAKYVEFPKEENQILWSRIKGHTNPEERKRPSDAATPCSQSISPTGATFAFVLSIQPHPGRNHLAFAVFQEWMLMFPGRSPRLEVRTRNLFVRGGPATGPV